MVRQFPRSIIRAAAVSAEAIAVVTVPDEDDPGSTRSTFHLWRDGGWRSVAHAFAVAALGVDRGPAGDGGDRVAAIDAEGRLLEPFSGQIDEGLVAARAGMANDHILGPIADFALFGDEVLAVGWGGQVWRRQAGGWRPGDLEFFDRKIDETAREALFQKFINGTATEAEQDAYVRAAIDSYGKTPWSLAALAPGDAYACGDEGLLVHFDGARATRIDTHGETRLARAAVGPDGRIWVCGEDATVLVGTASDGFVRQVLPLGDFDFTRITAFGKWICLIDHPDRVLLLEGRTLVELRPPFDPPPKEIHTITVVDGILWIVSHKDILRFDGAQWRRLPFPPAVGE